MRISFSHQLLLPSGLTLILFDPPSRFLIAVRQKDGEMLMNEAGEVTSHLMGTFYRTIRMVEHGIKPCYVFDGKPPDMKKGVVSPPSLVRWTECDARESS